MSHENCPAVEESSANPKFPLTVAYDAQAFVMRDGGTGKGTYLRNFLGSRLQEFTGLAPEGTAGYNVSLLQRGRSNYLLWQQTTLPRLLGETKPDIFIAPYIRLRF